MINGMSFIIVYQLISWKIEAFEMTVISWMKVLEIEIIVYCRPLWLIGLFVC